MRNNDFFILEDWRQSWRDTVGLQPCHPHRLFQGPQTASNEGLFNYCRSLSISALYHSRIKADLPDLTSAVPACNKLREVNIFLGANEFSPKEFGQMWKSIARHLSTQNLEIFRLYVNSSASVDAHPPFFTENRKLSVLGICHLVTHLSINEVHDNFDYFFTGALSDFKNLKSFSFLPETDPEDPHEIFYMSEYEAFWASLKRLPLQDISFTVPYPALSWADGEAILPPYLKNVVIKVSNYRYNTADCNASLVL
jgi:hypothetical protein